MIDPAASEPPFEILILTPEAGASPARRTLAAPPLAVGAPRPDRWLFVTHLLVLLSLAGLVVCIVGLVRLSRSPDGETGTAAAPGRAILEAAAATTEPAAGGIEPIRPALAPGSGAEGPSPAGSKPQAAPPAPALERVAEAIPPLLEVEAVPEPAELRPAVAEDAEARKLLDEARSLEAANPAQGAARYRKVLELLPGKTELWKIIADLELGRGASEEAARAYREFLRSHPDRADALQNLAILELRLGRAAEARACLEAAIKSAPSADLYYNLGNLHLKSANSEAAVAAYRRALEYDPRHGEARFNLALALERAGKRAEAVSALAKLGTVSPEVVRERARMEAALGGLEASRALDLARGSGDVEMVLSVAAGFRQAGELEKALALLDRAVDLAPQLASARLNRGALRQAMGRAAEAVADYEQAASLDPALPEARFNLGVLAEERAQYVAALGHYAAALKANPEMACALNNVGALYLKVGQPEKAVDWFHRCRTADSGFTGARLNLAWAYLAMGSKELALKELRAYSQDVPKDQRSLEALRVLAELEAPASAAAAPR